MGWYNSNWQYRIPVEILATQVPGDLSDVTVRLDLSDAPTAFWSHVKSDGSDIVFTSSNGTTKLKRELEYFDDVDDKGAIHVRVTSISSVSNTKLYLYYGYSSAFETNDTDAFGSEFLIVAHLHDAPSGADSCKDSSQVQNDGDSTASSSLSTNPGIPSDGKCWESAGSNCLAIFPDHADYDVSGDLTIIASWNVDDTGTHGIASRDINSWMLFNSNGLLRGRISSSSRFESSYSWSSNTWYRSAMTFSDSNDRVRHYINGSQQGSDVYCTQSLQAGSTDIKIGFEQTAAPNYLDGEMNEVKIVNQELTEDWLSFEYNFLNSPSSVFSYGTEEENVIIIELTGISSEEGIGSLNVSTGNVNLSIDGIPSSESIGIATINPGNVNLSIDGINSEESIGSLQINLNFELKGISSGEEFPDISFILGNVDLIIDGIDSDESLGTITIEMKIGEIVGIDSSEDIGIVDITSNYYSNINGIDSEESIGNVVLTTNINIIGIQSEEDLGILETSMIIFLNGINSQEQCGTFDTNKKISIDISGIASEEELGLLAINQFILISGVDSEENLGILSVSQGNINLDINGIGSQELLGSLIVNQNIEIVGIDSQEYLGDLFIGKKVMLYGIDSEEELGYPILSGGNTILSFNGIDTEENLGWFTLDLLMQIDGIDSDESVGNLQIKNSIFVDGIDSQEDIGVIALTQGSTPINIQGIDSQENVGIFTLYQETLLSLQGITSEEDLGNIGFDYTLDINGINSGELLGTITINSESAFLNITGIDSEEKFGFIDIINRQLLDISGIESQGDVGTIIFLQDQFLEVNGITTGENVGFLVIKNRLLSTFEQDHFDDIDEVFLSDFAVQNDSSDVIYTYIQTGEQIADLNVIFDNEYAAVDPETGASIMSSQPNIVVATNKFIHRPSKGDHINIHGRTFYVKTYEPDGTGTAVLTLEKT